MNESRNLEVGADVRSGWKPSRHDIVSAPRAIDDVGTTAQSSAMSRLSNRLAVTGDIPQRVIRQALPLEWMMGTTLSARRDIARSIRVAPTKPDAPTIAIRSLK